MIQSKRMVQVIGGGLVLALSVLWGQNLQPVLSGLGQIRFQAGSTVPEIDFSRVTSGGVVIIGPSTVNGNIVIQPGAVNTIGTSQVIIPQVEAGNPALQIKSNSAAATDYALTITDSTGTIKVLGIWGYNVLTNCEGCVDFIRTGAPGTGGRIAGYDGFELSPPGFPEIVYKFPVALFGANTSGNSMSLASIGPPPVGWYMVKMTGVCVTSGAAGGQVGAIKPSINYNGHGAFAFLQGDWNPLGTFGGYYSVAEITNPCTAGSNNQWYSVETDFYADGINTPTWGATCLNISGTPCSSSFSYNLGVTMWKIQ